MVNPILRALYLHQEWADAEHWCSFEAFPSAFTDPDIRRRLHHIHFVQHAFLWIVEAKDQPFRRTSVDDFSLPGDLKEYARDFHTRMSIFLDAVSLTRLQEKILVPWFKDPSLDVTVEEALTQVVMHSQNHRAQNATRLREIGGVAPLTDFIAWLWKAKPAPHWP